MKTIAHHVFTADRTSRVVASLDFVNEEVYDNGYYTHMRGYVFHLRSETIQDTGDGYARVIFDVHSDMYYSIVLYKMKKGERRTKRLDEEMIGRYTDLVEEYSDVIQKALRGEE